MRRYRSGIEEEPVDCDECCKRRKNRQQTVVGDASAQKRYAMIRNISVDAQQDILPTACGYLGRAIGEPPATLIDLPLMWRSGRVHRDVPCSKKKCAASDPAFAVCCFFAT